MKSQADRKSFPLPSIADFIFMSLFLYLSFSAGRALLSDCDTGWHVRVGEYIMQNLSVPRHDMFSFHTPALPWTAHEWLSEVIMAIVHRYTGLTGVVVFFTFFIALTYFLLFRHLRSYNYEILCSIVITLLAITSSQVHWLARPHIFSLCFMVVWYHILSAYQYQSKNYLYFLPLSMLLWVNLHGGYIAGLIILCIFLLGNAIWWILAKGADRHDHLARFKTLGLTASACLAATLVNPHGYHILLFPFKLVSNSYLMEHVDEFLSPNFHEMAFKSFLLYLLATIALVSATKERLNIIEVMLLLVFTDMALVSSRHIPLFSIIAAPILARHAHTLFAASSGRIAEFFRKRSRTIAHVDSMSIKYVWAMLAVIVVFVAVAEGRISYSFDPNIKPVAAVNFLQKESLAGNMFNNDELGDYILYAAHDQYKVFIDGRLDMYGSDLLKDYYKITRFKPGWEDVMAKYHITWVIYYSDSLFSRYLLKCDDWRLIYSDKVADIFVKNIPQYRNLITKYRDVRPFVEKKSSFGKM